MSRVLHVLNDYRPALTPEGEFLERCSAAMQEIDPEVVHDLLVIRTPRPAQPWEAAGCSTLARVAYLARRPRGAALQGAALSWWLLRNLRRYDAVHFREGARPGRLDHLVARLLGRRLLLPAPGPAGAALPALPAPWGNAPERPGAAARLRERLGLAADALVLLLPAVPARPEEALFLVDQLPAVTAEAPRARLLLGTPVGAEAFRARARELGVEGHLAVAGEAGGPLPAPAADILVLAERVEEPGGALAEGMARGLPVVAPRGTVLVADGETGSLYDTPAGYAAAVVRLAADAALRDRLGKAGRERARHLSGLGGLARRQLEMYRAGAPARPGAGLPAPALRRPEDGETGLGATASVLDERFHRPVPVAADAPPRVLTMVDAEEAFDWSEPFSSSASDVRSMGQQHLAQRVFARHGVVPLYLVDYPVANQEAGRGPLREFLRDGACEIGAQMHPWVTPPFEELVCDHNSYAGNLPPRLELEKARRLTDLLGEAFGERPLIYRTGRFGVGPRTADVLRHLGYLADTSVMPGWQPDRKGHWGHWGLTPRPYWCDRERTLMEIPVTGALVGRLARRHGARVAGLAFHPTARRMGLTGTLSHLGLLERIRLSPEGMTLDEGKRLVRTLLADGHRTFVLTYHSPSLAPGNTPYVSSEPERDRFLDWLDGFYSFFREEVGGRPASWREVRGLSPAPPRAGEAARAALRHPAEPALEPPSPA
ncbi:glycosyltransferase [Roseomonas nepalensis]|uniref:Glycosyltransferase n=1 Tax=Muricoccus nepalensis TaxID=1854500 RepID=A0A502GHN3_9PROT|nr:glycosyltransferase [Roseomonas nepalensis]TPG61092.1 glycosyltransferase [Roseomonas nepalensis]